MEQDLEKQLQEINSNLVEIKKKTGSGIWRAFFNGMFSALGYVAGLAVVIVVLGWFLNKMGLLSAFKEQVGEFQTFFNQAKQVMNIGGGSSTPASSDKQQGTDAFITLPDGKQVKIQIPK